jgi:hypothetical protein
MVFAGDFNMVFSGVKKPWVTGRIRAACRSFPTVVWNTFQGIAARCSMACASLIYFLALSFGRQTVRLIPSKKKPIIVFVVSKFPSPLSSFPFDMGSLLFSWLVIAVSGKKACIPWMAACQT